MNQELFRSNYKKKYGSTKNATKAWNRRLERFKQKALNKLMRSYEDSLLHDQDPRERI